eukprot:82592-Rhodomonas_salina.2
MVLRLCYALSGTDTACPPRCPVLSERMLLPGGTLTVSKRRSVPCRAKRCVCRCGIGLLTCYATPDTDLAYGATRENSMEEL